MKVAALSPQFVINAPEGPDPKDANASRARLSVVGTEKSSATDQDGGAGSGGNHETRSGLKRLAQFISNQRRAPDHEKPEPPSIELRERPTSEDSHEFTKLMLQWSRRPRVINSMAQVIADEFKRRRALKVYERMQAVTKKPEQKPREEESGLPAMMNF